MASKLFNKLFVLKFLLLPAILQQVEGVYHDIKNDDSISLKILNDYDELALKNYLKQNSLIENFKRGYYNVATNGFDIKQKRSSRLQVYRRGCVRRGGACDNRPNDCCFDSSCRCNLWGSNCRCQRMGLFQKWG